MPFLVFFIVISFSFYVYYKIKYIRSQRPMEKKMLSGKSGMTLGIFVALFGLNQILLFSTTLTYVIGALFILLGLLNAYVGYKNYRHHVPYAIREAEELK